MVNTKIRLIIFVAAKDGEALYSQHPTFMKLTVCIGVFLRWLSGKESACNAGDEGSIPGSGKSPGEGNGNPLQYSCIEDSMDRAA